METVSYTIGFGKKTASKFFDLLRLSSAHQLIDVRLNNTSQLSGFAKKDDLKFFLKQILNWDYIHIPELAPSKEILDKYKKYKGDWIVYKNEFLNLMEKRRIDTFLTHSQINSSCLLCSEDKPHNCHRKLILDYLNEKWASKITVKHLF